MNEINEKMSLKMGVKFAVQSVLVGFFLDILYEVKGKILRQSYNNVTIDQLDVDEIKNNRYHK